MCVLSLNAFPKTNTTTTSPDPHHLKTTNPAREENTVSSLSSQPLILLTALTARQASRGRADIQLRTQAQWQEKRCINHVGRRANKASDGRFLWNAAQLADRSLSHREFPQVGLSLWLSAVLYGVTLSKNTCGIIFQENPNNHCFSYLGFSTFNYDLFRKMIWQSVLPLRSFWS